MSHIFFPRGVLFILPFLFLSACKSSDSSESKDSTGSKVSNEQNSTEDTRVLVQEAYKKIDHNKLTVAFNELRAEMIKTQLDSETDAGKRINMALHYGFELLKAGKTEESLGIYSVATKFIAENNLEMDSATKRNLYSTIGIAFMRHGEIENCLKNHNHESCFIPIKGGGVHQLPFGSSNAITQYEKSLKEFPNDLETQYLLNIAYMTLGQYPDKVPAKHRIDPSWFKSKINIKPFKDIAPELGLNRNGHAGGTIVDDFTNDGWLDIVITSWDPTEELIFYVNNGDGSFSDQTEAYGLKGHVGILNLNQADFNNDGWLDMHLMRGAWWLTQGSIPSTLLMNTGKGSFVDVTVKSGTLRYSPSQASAWADFNLDGWLDLVVANESLPDYEKGIDFYINQKDGTFSHESKAYGFNLSKFFKGCVATDVNNDRYPDIYMSASGSENILMINQGSNGKNQFIQTGPEIKIEQPIWSFPCWSFDYDNDGNEDLFVSGYSNDGTPSYHWMRSKLGKPAHEYLPKLYHNKGNMVFEEKGLELGLNEVAFTMGCNFGDINTDGFLDFYLGTGNPTYQSLVPNKVYLNMEGKRFEDVSYSGGFANIQKGHGVGFGDLDHDGDEDIYMVIGGAFDGDNFYNTLFENPNEHNHNWVILKFVGVTANRAAIGARVALTVSEGGKERKIYRTISSGASFGANSLILEVGLGKSDIIKNVSVQWPCKDCPDQTFTGLEINKAYTITQDKPTPEPMNYTAVKFKPAQVHSGHDHH